MSQYLRPIQTGGMCHAWSSPDRTFKHIFLKLQLDCEPDKYPGVVIVSDENHNQTSIAAVKNLSRELPQLLAGISGKSIAYWSLEEDEGQINKILVGLTAHPIFFG